MPTRKVRDGSPKGYHWQEYDGPETWQEQEARKPRALRAARLEAHMIWEGHDQNVFITKNVGIAPRNRPNNAD